MGFYIYIPFDLMTYLLSLCTFHNYFEHFSIYSYKYCSRWG